MVTESADERRARILARYASTSDSNAPWSWQTMSAAEALDLALVLDEFVGFYNETFATAASHVVPACWPAHPGLAHELAVLHGLWAEAWLSGREASTPADAATWLDRWLPSFQRRLPDWLGREPADCRRGSHANATQESPGWNEAGDTIAAVAATAIKDGRDARVREAAVRLAQGLARHPDPLAGLEI